MTPLDPKPLLPHSTPRRNHPRRTAMTVAMAIAGLVFACLLHTKGTLIETRWTWVLLFLVPTVFLVHRLARRIPDQTTPSLAWGAPLLALFGCLVFYLFTGSTSHFWSFFINWPPDPDRLSRSSLFLTVLLTGLLTPLFVIHPRRIWVPVLLVLAGAQIACLYVLLAVSHGLPLYRTDHPSFMFRLWEFTSSFPQLVSYNPYWRGGALHPYSVTSGVAGPGLLLWPLWRSFPIHEVYTLGVGLIYIGLVPWIAVCSLRAMGSDRTSAYAAGILSLGVSQYYFLWMLHYGTIGAPFSKVMVIPLSALVFRVLYLNRTDWRTGLALLLAAFGAVLWPAGALPALAVAFAALVNFRAFSKRKFVFLAVCGLLAVLLYSRWILAILFQSENIVGFVMEHPHPIEQKDILGLGRAALDVLGNGTRSLLDQTREANPLLVFFGLLGVLACPYPHVRRWVLPSLAALLVIAEWGKEWKPNLQLARMAIPLFLLTVIPASLAIGRILRIRDQRLAVVQACLLSLLIMTACNVYDIYHKRGPAPYTVLNEQVQWFTTWVRTHVPEHARVLFAGRCVHSYGRGNVAYLPALTGREMMADDYYGFPVGTIEYNYPPREFRKDFDRMKLFFDAYNVSHVVTVHEAWKNYMNERPEYFQLASTNDNISIYRLRHELRSLFKGDGTVDATFNRMDVHLTGFGDEVVLAYNWVPGLVADPGVELFPHTVTEGITLIGARPAGRKTFTIRYRSRF